MPTTEVGAKGRLVIPAQVRAEAGMQPGQAVVVRADGAGRIVIETLDAVQERVWAAAPTSDPGIDAVRDVRTDDTDISDDAAARRARGPAPEPDEPDEAGAALLAALDR